MHQGVVQQIDFKLKPISDHRNLKIAFTTTGWDGSKSDPACIEAVEETAKLLESLGHKPYGLS